MDYLFCKDLRESAKKLKQKYGIEYDKVSMTILMNGYLKAKRAHNETDKNLFASGILLRKWGAAGKLKMRSPGFGDLMEYVFWIYEAIELACQYAAWLNPAKNVTAEQALNRCIETIRVRHHYESNLDKHKANYNNMSLDDQIDSEEATTFGDTLVDKKSLEEEGTDLTYDLIQKFISRRQLVEAIIIDTIAFNDAEHVVKTKEKYTDEFGNIKTRTVKTKEFWEYQCVKLLNSLPADYTKYFSEKYIKVVPKELDIAVSSIRQANNQKLYRLLRKTREVAKTIINK